MQESFSSTCPILVGREPEFAALRAWADQARGAKGVTVLLSGEPGVGKTRLAEEIASRCRDAGDLVLRGACHDADQGTAFAPWRDILHDLVLAIPPERLKELVRPVANELRSIAPELAPHLPTTADSLPGTVADRRVLFHALLTVLDAVSREQPLAVVVEDLQWADDASLECVRYLARRISHSSVLLLLTARQVAAGAAPEGALADLLRDRLVERVALESLNPGDVTQMLGAMFDLERPAGPVFVHRLHEITGGNPLFVEEAVATLLAMGAIHRSPSGAWQRQGMEQLPVPATIQDAVQDRIATLGDPAREVLLAASVIGQEVDYDLLAAVCGLPEAELLEAMRELVATRLLVELAPDRFAFHHALTRQAVASSLLARERRAWHRQVAFALLARHDVEQDRHLEAIVHHLVAAGEWSEALPRALRAGARALDLGAPFAAILHLGYAEEAATALGEDIPPSLYLTRGRAHVIVGEFDLALADFSQLADLARDAGDHPLSCVANLELAALWSGRDYRIAGRYVEQALDLARTIDDQDLLARCLNLMGNWHTNQDEPDVALTYHREALELAQRRNDRPGEARTLDLMAMASSIGDDVLAAVDYARRSLVHFEALGDRLGIAGSFGTNFPSALVESQTLVGTGTLAGARLQLERNLEIAEDLDWQAGKAFALGILGDVHTFAGDLGRGLASATEAHEIASGIGHGEWALQALLLKATALHEIGDTARAAELLDEASAIADRLHSTLWRRAVAAARAQNLVRSGDIEGAEATLAIIGEPPLTTSNGRFVWLARAELLLAQGKPADALELIDRLYATARHLTQESEIPALALVKAEALLIMGRPDEALPLMEATLAVVRLQGAGLLEARTLGMLARLHAAVGEPGAAATARVAAARLVDRIAATIPPGPDRERYQRMASAALKGETEGGSPAHPGALTDREYEVARLVAEGLSNRGIAERLYLGERTIETHVSNTLRKLGFTSRTQIATWIVEHT